MSGMRKVKIACQGFWIWPRSNDFSPPAARAPRIPSAHDPPDDPTPRDCHPMRMTQPTPPAGPAPAAAPASPSADTAAAVVLVNLGTPQAPTAQAVRAYLREFLSDRRVVDLPRVLWWPLLNLVILPLRCARVARKYAQVWMADGS